MVEITDIRNALAGISTQRLSDDTINVQIEIATTTIESEKSSAASAEVVEDAKLVLAVYLCLAAYASKLERSLGGIPPEVERQKSFWEAMQKRFLVYVKRSSAAREPPIALTESTTTIIEEEL